VKIYTKTGDEGNTSLIGGTRVPKFHIQVEAYGTVDELISFTGLLRDQDIGKHHKESLILIQDKLMACASILAADCENCDVKIPDIVDSDVKMLEDEIDRMDAGLPPLSSFVLPGGHTSVSFCHIARSVCRRAERNVLKLDPDIKNLDIVIKYLNRLSDYFFMLSRKLAKEFNVKEIPWNPGL
jgi:cob(I)alamin adenosyltransferase